MFSTDYLILNILKLFPFCEKTFNDKLFVVSRYNLMKKKIKFSYKKDLNLILSTHFFTELIGLNKKNRDN